MADDERPRRLTRAEARAQTRERLLDAAADLFSRKGYAGASVEEIADLAGYSTGALYSNFSGKEALFLELMAARGTDRLGAAAELLEGSDLDLTTAAGDLGRLLVSVADQDRAFGLLQAEFWLYAVRNPHVLDHMAEHLAAPRAGLAQLAGSVLERLGIADLPPEQVATVVQALFGGLVRQRRIDPESVPEELFGKALLWLFAGIAGRAGDS